MSTVDGVALLKVDADLGAAVPAEDREHAERLVVVPCLTADVGPLVVPQEHVEPSLGMLVLDGLLTINVVLGERVASQLAGPGDIIDLAAGEDTLLPASISCLVSHPARLAVLDRRFIAAARRWPTLLLALHHRLREQERRLAVHSAIGKLRRIENRVLALMWHLAERWGRIASDGVVVPLALTHETIGRLAGAERPTVSLALTELSRTGELTRREDGSFLLAHGSAERLRGRRTPEQQLRPLAVRMSADARNGDRPERAGAVERFLRDPSSRSGATQR